MGLAGDGLHGQCAVRMAGNADPLRVDQRFQIRILQAGVNHEFAIRNPEPVLGKRQCFAQIICEGFFAGIPDIVVGYWVRQGHDDKTSSSPGVAPGRAIVQSAAEAGRVDDQSGFLFESRQSNSQADFSVGRGVYQKMINGRIRFGIGG